MAALGAIGDLARDAAEVPLQVGLVCSSTGKSGRTSGPASGWSRSFSMVTFSPSSGIIPFLSMPVEFPAYREGSDRHLALAAAVSKMLVKGAIEPMVDPQVNWAKSDLSSSQRKQFLGMILDTVRARVFMSPDWMWAVQWCLKRNWRAASNLDWRRVAPNHQCLQDLAWRLVPNQLLKGAQFLVVPPRTDPIFGCFPAQVGSSLGRFPGFRSLDCGGAGVHINHLELLAVFRALQSFQQALLGSVVSVMPDISTMVTYLRKSGGTRSEPLSALAGTVLRWCESHSISLCPFFVPGRCNVIADVLSQECVGSEWTLHPKICRKVFQVCGSPLVDLFATALTRHLSLYVSPLLDLFSVGQSGSVCLSTVRSDPPCSGKSSRVVGCAYDTSCSFLASGRLVSPVAGSACGQTLGSSHVAVSPSTTSPSPLPRFSREAPSSHVAILQHFFRARGLLCKAAKFMSRPVRQSSASVYQVK
ncbi:hypothetical protein E2C01_022657 [Portunus trituberculatus]|uniref:Uncharacterized protein n=1 Tax=Portunus trituberculatus TaxID=210409 RepID=A0A5B7E7W1_PORTR|nr:hypothetical protein [Portunus trituberculatus]